MIDAELYERGWNKKFKRHTSLNLPVKHFEQITFTKTNDNANFQNNNPELISHTISEILGKQYSLNYLFEPDVANAHMNGELYIHDMGQPNRYYCWASSLAYILKNGLKLDSVTSRSLPAKSASVLTGHLQTYLASMQAYFAGAIGITYTNIVYAPLLRGLTDKQIKQICQEIVFSISQTAFARGGQSLPPSEPIIIRHNDKVQVVRIGELVDEQIKKFGGPTQDTSVERTGYNLEGIEVLSFTPEKVCKFLPITDFIRTKHNKKNLVGLTTNRGTCNVTDYHSVFSLDNGVIKPVKALDLNVGDSIVAANKVDFNDTIESFGGLKTNETFGEMLAHTLFSIALASTGKYYLKIMNNDEIIEDFELAYRKLFGRNSNITVRHFGQPNTKTSTLDLDEDQKTEFINAFNICLSKDLSLPEFAYYLPPKTKKAFIEKAIWISEKAYNKKNCICLKGNDNYKKDRMATGINFLLSTINKLGSTQTVGHNTYDIYVSDNNEDYLGKARISHIKEYACGGYVYDLSVGETNAFCGGTGLSFYHNTIFTDLNLHYNIPYYMQHTAAILPGGKYGVYVKENTHNTGREKPCYKGDLPTLETGENYYDPSDGLKHKIVFVDTLSEATKLYNNIRTADNVKDCHVLTYKDFEPECQKMMSFLIDVYREGDADGKPFFFPKPNVHIEDGMLEDENVRGLVEKTCELAAYNGSPYFVYDRGKDVKVSMCCLTGDTKVFAKEGGQIKVINIRDYQQGMKVLSYNTSMYKKEWVVPEKFLELENKDKILRVTLSNGSVVNMTKDHVCLYFDNSSLRIQEKTADKLCVNDFLPAIKHIYRDEIINEVSREYLAGKFVGYYLAYGQPFGKKRASWKLLSTQLYAINDISSFIAEMYPDDPEHDTLSVRKCSEARNKIFAMLIKYENSGIVNYLKKYLTYDEEGGFKLRDCVFGMGQNFISGLVEAVCNGHFHARKDNYRCFVYNKTAAIQLQTLFKMVGADVEIEKVDKENFSQKTELRVAELSGSNVLWRIKVLGQHNLRKSFCYNDKSTQREKRVDVYSPVVNSFIKKIKKGIKRNPDKKFYKRLLNAFIERGNLSCVKVVKIEEVEPVEKVYDFTVNKENPTFVLANGLATHNCRLTTSGKDISEEMIMKPDTISFIGVQNVSINSPHCGFTAAKKLNINPFGTKSYDMRALIDATIEETKRVMDLAVKAHKNRRRHIKKLLVEGAALHFTSKSAHGKPLVDVDKGTYLIGLIGINNLVQFITGGHQMHEDKKYLQIGIEIVAHMSKYCKELTEKHKMKITLEESPAETAAGSLARLDYKTFGDFIKPVLRGENEGNYYYDNSVHFTEGSVDFIKKIIDQSRFHPLVQSGNIIHVWIGEKKPSKDAIFKIVEMTQKKTQAKQIVFSPIFTFCDTCGWFSDGQVDECGKCGEKENISLVTRVVGYFSKINGWNNSKKSEFMKRNYENIDPKTNY